METEKEKLLDMDGILEDAAEAEQAEEQAKRKPPSGQYTHTFKKPFLCKGRAIDTLTFDWTALTGRDHLEIENEILLKGRMLISPAFTGDFLAGMAANACTERDEKGKRIIDANAIKELPLGDFQAITGEARDFLLRME